jgi:hypothetical protein
VNELCLKLCPPLKTPRTSHYPRSGFWGQVTGLLQSLMLGELLSAGSAGAFPSPWTLRSPSPPLRTDPQGVLAAHFFTLALSPDIAVASASFCVAVGLWSPPVVWRT